MTNTHRFDTMKEAVTFLMSNYNCTNQEAYWVVVEEGFQMGTDKAIWLNTSRFVTGS